MMKMPLKTRQFAPEVMDALGLEPCDHERALNGLERINRLSAVVRTAWKLIQPLAQAEARPLRVLDLASGAGDFPIGLKAKSRAAGIPLTVDGCDKSEVAVEYARRKAKARGEDVRFFRLDVLGGPLPAAYDVITSNLFLHHLERQEALALMKKIAEARPRLVIFNDLDRTLAGLAAAYAAPRLLTRSRIVHFDAVQSVRNAFRAREAAALAQETGWRAARVQKIWPFRFLLVWRPDES